MNLTYHQEKILNIVLNTNSQFELIKNTFRYSFELIICELKMNFIEWLIHLKLLSKYLFKNFIHNHKKNKPIRKS